jgi:hypothetical protein
MVSEEATCWQRDEQIYEEETDGEMRQASTVAIDSTSCQALVTTKIQYPQQRQ